MSVSLNLNVSTFLAKAGARSFFDNVASFKIYRMFSAKIYNNTVSYRKTKRKRDKLTGVKPQIKGFDVLAEAKPVFSDECYNETSYYFENGLRKVYPYYYTFKIFTKARWVGKTIYEVFAKEFRELSMQEYEQTVNEGRLLVNYQKIDKDYILKHDDLIVKRIHRHEYPVINQPISIIHIDQDVVVVNKPCSIPVHPCGKYRHNSMHFILGKEFELKNILTIHRLDRLTSGLLMFGRTDQKTKELIQQIRSRSVSKQYICRVDGEFPDQEIVCVEPIQTVSDKIGFAVVNCKGKESITHFKKMSYNGKSSVVLCTPKTGRMHQIRVHLQYLGFPVVNDSLYNHVVFGPLKGKGGDLGGKTLQQLGNNLLQIFIERNTITSPLTLDNEKLKLTLQEHKCMSVTNQVTDQNTFDPNKYTVNEYCYECSVLFKEPKPEDLVMFLHAWKYEGPGWKYETELPDWTKTDYNQL